MPELTKLGGVGPDVILLHGYGSDRQSWLATTPALFDHLTVWVMDLPAHGNSVSVCNDGSIDALANAVLAAADNACVTTFHLIGHSLGGRVGLHIAANTADRVLSIIGLAPAGLGERINKEFLRQFAAADDTDAVYTLLLSLVQNEKLMGREFATTVLERLCKPDTRESLLRIADGLVTAEAVIPETIIAIQTANIDRMLIWGANDAINPINKDAAIAFGGNLHVFDDCGHLPHIERRLPTNKLLIDFYKFSR